MPKPNPGRVPISQVIWSTVFLLIAAALALLGAMARQQGQIYASVFLSILSLVFLIVVSVTLVPRLVLRVRLDFLNRLQFFRFTRRGAFFVLVVVLVALSSLNTGNNLLILVLSTLMAALIVSGLIASVVLDGLKISLRAPDAIHAGQKAVFMLTLQNLKRLFPSIALKLKSRKEDDREPDGTDFFVQEKMFPFIKAGGTLSLPFQCSFERRGIFPVTGFEVRTTFPFGFFSRGRDIEAAGNIVVYPRLRDVAQLALLHPFLEGSQEKNRRGAGGSLYNIRLYQPGDDARHVHWKSTAKTGRLMVRDLSVEEDQPVSIGFSTFLPVLSPAALGAFEAAVSYVASLCHHYYRQRQIFMFDSGEFQARVNGQEENYRTLMEYLASVQPSKEEKLNPANQSPGSVLFTAVPTSGAARGPVIDYLSWSGVEDVV
ncbi:MAG: DUF58 domain-containing protein [Acidobacteria bacterium]|nr:MAG: DUF58 domain-containing protein [Acidobacteriota bacterium]